MCKAVVVLLEVGCHERRDPRPGVEEWFGGATHGMPGHGRDQGVETQGHLWGRDEQPASVEELRREVEPQGGTIRMKVGPGAPDGQSRRILSA